MGEHLIVVIDEQADIRHAATLLLESHGYTVRAYPSGEAFLGDVRRRRVACIVADVLPPSGRSGALLDALREAAPTPIVVLTSDPDAVPRDYLDGQICAVLQKPVSPEVLMQTIESVLSAA